MTLSQDQFNHFSFSYLNEPNNCKLNRDLSDFSQICAMKSDFSNTKQCQFCRFRRTFFIFKIPALALFTAGKDSGGNDHQKRDFGLKFRDSIERFWRPMLNYLCGRVANVGYKLELQKTKNWYKIDKQAGGKSSGKLEVPENNRVLSMIEPVNKPLETQHVKCISIEREVNSYMHLQQPQFKLIETYCNNLKTQDEYYSAFKNLWPTTSIWSFLRYFQ